MDITLLRASIFDLPSKQRLDALVYDGSQDMQLWPGRGPDGDLDAKFGGTLQAALDAEVRQLPGRQLPMHGVSRVTRGRLHCDFLAWVATRPPQPGTRPEPAPDAAGITAAVKAALAFAAERHVQRIGFSSLGAGPGELPPAERLALVVKAAHAWEDERAAQGLGTGVEEVLVCEPTGSVFHDAATSVRGLASIENPVARAPRKKAAVVRGRRAGGGGSRKPKAKGYDFDLHRSSAIAYSPQKTFTEGDWIAHKRFGVGRVEETGISGEIRQIHVAFEDGVTRRLVHARG